MTSVAQTLETIAHDWPAVVDRIKILTKDNYTHLNWEWNNYDLYPACQVLDLTIGGNPHLSLIQLLIW